jgi:hypothetical protein
MYESMTDRDEISASSQLAHRVIAHLAADTPDTLTDVWWHDGTPDREIAVMGGWDQADTTPRETLDYAVINSNLVTVYFNGDPSGSVRWTLFTQHEDENGFEYKTETAAGESTGDPAAVIAAIRQVAEAH